jgi:hypothetical protein
MPCKSFTYEIAGHFIEIVWKLPDGQHWQLPGFAPFLSKKITGTENDPQTQNSSENKLLTVNVISIEEAQEDEDADHAAQDRIFKNPERTVSPEQIVSPVQIVSLEQIVSPERKISSFEIENGTCELCKQDNSYKFQIFTIDGKLSVKLEMGKGRSAMNCLCALYENSARQMRVPDPHHLRFAIWMAGGFAGIPEWTAAIHASVIIYENQAVLFLGESGTGKSTHTRLWLDNIPGTRLLNDDSPIIRLHKCKNNHNSKGNDNGNGNGNGRQENPLYIYGSPWSGKGNIYRNECYQVAAIVRLQQAPYNRSTRLNVMQAFAALYPSFPPAYLKDEDLHEEICTIISGILKTIPVFRLECLPKPSAAILIHQKIFIDEVNLPGNAKLSNFL